MVKTLYLLETQYYSMGSFSQDPMEFALKLGANTVTLHFGFIYQCLCYVDMAFF